MSSAPDRQIFEFEGLFLDANQRLLFNADGEPVPLTSRAFDTLLFLVEHAGELLHKEELMEAVWPDSVVEENNLSQCIVALRRALGESPSDHHFIVTIPGRGYRFIPVVKRVTDGSQAGVGVDSALRRSRLRRRGWRGLSWRAAFWLSAVSMSGIMTVVLLNGHFHLDRSAGGGRETSAVSPSRQPSVAVLSFTDLSPGGDQAYFAQGIAEELQSQLSRLEGLVVAGRSSSFSFRGTKDDLQTIGRKLGVSNILQGSVRREGDRVRISAQLIDTTSGYQRWSQTYERESGDIFAIQDEIAKAVAGALSIALGVDARNLLQGVGTHNFEAYDNFLAGSVHLRDGRNLGQSIVLFNRAIELDPNYAAAWAALALTYGQASWGAVRQDALDLLDKGYQVARHAVELDPKLAEAHSILAQLTMAHNDWLGAEAEHATALELSDNASTLLAYATLAGRSGRIDRALTYVNLSVRLDPFRPLISSWRSWFLIAQGRRADALAEIDRGSDLGVDGESIEEYRLYAQASGGAAPDVKRQLQRLAAMSSPDAPFFRAVLSKFESRPDVLLELRRWHGDEASQGPDSRLHIAVLAAYFGDPKFALGVMSGELHESTLRIATIWFPVFRTMRRLPDFKQLVQDLGLVAYWRAYGWPEACRPNGKSDFQCR